jgi:hypothetical protein
MGGQDAHPTRKLTLCGTGILPVFDNSARCEFDRPCADRTKKPTQSFQPSIIEGKSNG